MSEVNTLKKSLPDMEHSFSLVDEVGDLTKKTYSGNFICKISNLKTQSLIGKHRAMLDAGLPGLDKGLKRLHEMISYLRFTLIDSPKWWKDADMGFELLDISIVESVYGKVLKFESDWVDSVWGNSEEAKSNEPKVG